MVCIRKNLREKKKVQSHHLYQNNDGCVKDDID